VSHFHDTAMRLKARTKPAGDGRFGAQIVTFENGVKGVLKVQQTSCKAFRGVPFAEFHKREVAAYRLDRDLLMLSVVPETLLIKWRGQEASLQHYVEGFQAKDLVPGVFDRKLSDWKYKVAQFADRVALDVLADVVLLDMCINNVDRHGKNVIVDTHNKGVFAIDNAASFFDCLKCYKNIFHKYLFFSNLEVPEVTRTRLASIRHRDLSSVLGSLLSPKDVEYTYWRIRFVVDHSDRLAFARVSQGNFGNNEFPSYSEWFRKKMHPKQEMLVLTRPSKPGVVEDRVDA
jgi:hypothetical protein